MVPVGAVVPEIRNYNFKAIKRTINTSIKAISKIEVIKKLVSPFDIYNQLILFISLFLRANSQFDIRLDNIRVIR